MSGRSSGHYSGGKKISHLIDGEEVKFVIPSNIYLENQTVNLTFEVEYYYAEKISDEQFVNKFGSENLNLDLKIYSPGEQQKLIDAEILKKQKFCKMGIIIILVLIAITIFCIIMEIKSPSILDPSDRHEVIGFVIVFILVPEILVLYYFLLGL